MYIKLFEDFRNGEYYTQLSHDDMTNFVNKKTLLDAIPLSNKKKDKILSKLVDNNKYGWKVEERYIWGYIPSNSCEYICNKLEIPNVALMLSISEYDDEWYLVSLESNSGRYIRYYKCDQLEGLIKFLEDFKLTK